MYRQIYMETASCFLWLNLKPLKHRNFLTTNLLSRCGDQATLFGDQASVSGDQAVSFGDQASASGDQATSSGDQASTSLLFKATNVLQKATKSFRKWLHPPFFRLLLFTDLNIIVGVYVPFDARLQECLLHSLLSSAVNKWGASNGPLPHMGVIALCASFCFCSCQ